MSGNSEIALIKAPSLENTDEKDSGKNSRFENREIFGPNWIKTR